MVSTNLYLHTVLDQDGAALLDCERGLISTLNPTGAFVWQGLGRGDTIEKVISDLARETNMEVDLVRPDVLEFVVALTKAHLLTHVSRG